MGQEHDEKLREQAGWAIEDAIVDMLTADGWKSAAYIAATLPPMAHPMTFGKVVGLTPDEVRRFCDDLCARKVLSKHRVGTGDPVYFVRGGKR